MQRPRSDQVETLGRGGGHDYRGYPRNARAVKDILWPTVTCNLVLHRAFSLIGRYFVVANNAVNRPASISSL
jgi:hypothetical protein